MVVTRDITHNKEVIDKISQLLSKLDIKFNVIDDYIRSFVHRSIVNERPDFAPEHNERLEFLWDAVLELIITDSLYKNYKDKNEWELTDIRSALVRWKNLAIISRSLWFSDYLFLWKWEELWWWRESDYLLANTLEAFIWALYLDLWLESARKFINNNIYITLQNIIDSRNFKDFKSLIQEHAQAEFDITPTYEVIFEEGPDHDKNFKVWVYLGEILIWTGLWSSKKKAQEDAAKNAYENKEKWQIS